MTILEGVSSPLVTLDLQRPFATLVAFYLWWHLLDLASSLACPAQKLTQEEAAQCTQTSLKQTYII